MPRVPVRSAIPRSVSNWATAEPASDPKTHSGSGSGVTTVICDAAPRSRRSMAAMIASSYAGSDQPEAVGTTNASRPVWPTACSTPGTSAGPPNEIAPGTACSARAPTATSNLS